MNECMECTHSTVHTHTADDLFLPISVFHTLTTKRACVCVCACALNEGAKEEKWQRKENAIPHHITHNNPTFIDTNLANLQAFPCLF